MDNSLSQVEILPNQSHIHHTESYSKPWYQSQRLIIFVIVFILSALLSLAYVYSRPALFKTYATLLTVAQTAIDQQSSDADIQHVAIQRQILMGQSLLDETMERLKPEGSKSITKEQSFFSKTSTIEVRQMLSVQAVPETNLVELAATGYRPDVLVTFINTWIDVYLENRTEEIRQTTGVTLEILREELSSLEDKILIKRSELEYFREINDITSLGRENIFENQSLAHFKGLNKSLSDANEEAIKSKARLDAVNKSIAEGKMIVPDEDKRGMRVLELRLQELKEQLAEFDRKYTRNYLALHPHLNIIPGKIKALEKEIQKKRHYGQSIVLTEAEQNYEAALQTLIEISKQLEEHKRKATEFSSRFAEHESLLNDLEGLELLQRSSQERLVQIEAKQAEKFPQVKVIERAFIPLEPISPDYTKDAIIAIISSILLGLIAVWIIEFLTQKENPKTSISISGINMYKDATPGLINNLETVNDSITQDTVQSLQHDNNKLLEHKALKELSIDTLNALLEASDIKAKQLISMLLSGLNLEEISKIEKECFDFSKNSLNITGNNQRIISLNPALRTLFENTDPFPAWKKSQIVSVNTLEAILIYASADAGFTNPQEISAEIISNSYILYLVKQGLRLSELENIVGYIDPTELSKFAPYSPEKKGLSITDINILHPSLAIYAC